MVSGIIVNRWGTWRVKQGRENGVWGLQGRWQLAIISMDRYYINVGPLKGLPSLILFCKNSIVTCMLSFWLLLPSSSSPSSSGFFFFGQLRNWQNLSRGFAGISNHAVNGCQQIYLQRKPNPVAPLTMDKNSCHVTLLFQCVIQIQSQIN